MSPLVRVTLLASMLFLVSPFSAFAAEPPTCLVGVVTKDTGKVFTQGTVAVQKGDWAYVLWVSANGTTAVNAVGRAIAPSGFVRENIDVTRTYTYRFTSAGQEVVCSATLEVAAPVAVPEGPTTLRVSNVPLLSGGVAYPGASVPVAYVQVQNTGKNATTLKGFWIEQNGSASVSSVIGLTTIDDKGGLRGATGGTPGATPFVDGKALAPTEALFAPGQMRLFTVRATMAPVLTPYRNTQLNIDVTGIETDAAVTGTFPIPGTIWSIQ